MKTTRFFRVALLVAPAFFHPQSGSAQAPPKEAPPHTTFYLHGRFYTNDPANPWASAIAVRDGRIRCMGPLEHVLLDCGAGEANAETVNLKGQFVMPGFNDAHVHMGGAGSDMLAVRLNGAASVEELQKRLADAVAQHTEGEWITGSGWDHTLWNDRTFPNRKQLDAVSPSNPVLLTHISGHVAVANTLALKRAGVTKSTANPAGGEIEREPDGEPSGMLKEAAAMEMVAMKVPETSDAERRRGIELVLADLAKNGVTSVQDNSSWDDFLVYRQLKQEGLLTVRITEWLPFAAPLPELIRMRDEGGTRDPWLRTGTLKMITDGALGSRTAAMMEPYSDAAASKGILTMEPEKLRAMAIERDAAGFQLAFHAIGDRANRVALDVFEAVLKANGSRDRRDRIEHAQVVAPEDFPRFAKLKVIASMQPSHESTDMRWAEDRVGPERAKGAYAWNTMLKNNVRLAFGTDYDVEVISPMRGLYACLTRELPDGGPKDGWQPQERISLADCLGAYTSGSAYAEFEEGKKGELKVGEYADFIVLSADITKVPARDLTKTKVLRTVVGGRTVYVAR